MEAKEALRICVTGAAGQIAYSFLPMLCSGQVFGSRKIILRLLDIQPMEDALKGIVLELEDCAFENVLSYETGSDPKLMFKDIDVGIFIGGFPRKPGMERKDLLQINGKIFKEQGVALQEVASPNCKILVVANPANTNCLILLTNAPKIPKENFTCLTRLDHNRGLAQLAIKAGVQVSQVKNIAIWGNHSTTQYPDVNNGTIDGKPIRDVIKDEKYLNEDFIARVQKRGGEVLEKRKMSSVFSAANAVKDHLKTWFQGTATGEWVSMGVYSSGQYENIPAEIVYSMPVRTKEGATYEIVKDLKIDDFSRGKMKTTAEELLQEKAEALS